MSNNPYEAPQQIGEAEKPASQLDYANYPKIVELCVLNSFKQKTAPDKLLALVEQGFLYLSRQIAHWSSYENVADLLPWKEINEVIIKKHYSIPGFLGGCLALAAGIAAFIRGWITHTMTGAGTFFWPIAGLLGFLVFTFGVRRNKIVVKSGQKKYTWMSAPLMYRITLIHCGFVTWLCEKHSVPCRSHIHAIEPIVVEVAQTVE